MLPGDLNEDFSFNKDGHSCYDWYVDFETRLSLLKTSEERISFSEEEYNKYRDEMILYSITPGNFDLVDGVREERQIEE